jgi:hypothetical protein
VPFEYLAHFTTVPIRLGDIETRFIFDTGIGVNLISESLATRVGCAADGTTFTGRRMSGQEVTTPMGTLASLRLGDFRQESVPVGIFDLTEGSALDRVEGFLSLGFFQSVPVTVDYPARLVVIEDERSVARRLEAGVSVPVKVHRDKSATDVFLPVELPGGISVSVEVDSGSDTLILDEELAGELGIDLSDDHVRKLAGADEAGNPFTRYFTTLSGEITVCGAPRIDQASPDVMFQKIIYDGLLGDRFLRNFVVTYDLPSARLIFARPD